MILIKYLLYISICLHSTIAMDLPRLCYKNASKNFDLYSSNCYSNPVIKKNFTEKSIIVAIKSEHLVNGYVYRCSKFHKILQTKVVYGFKQIADTVIRETVSENECKNMIDNKLCGNEEMICDNLNNCIYNENFDIYFKDVWVHKNISHCRTERVYLTGNTTVVNGLCYAKAN